MAQNFTPIFAIWVTLTNECAPCVWPFEYDGTTYTEGYCRYSTGLRGKWCATETNEKNVYVDGQNYGMCDAKNKCTKCKYSFLTSLIIV